MKKGDLFPLAQEECVRYLTNKTHRIKYTGEKRPPKRGEWYISGAIAEGYLAPNDLSHPYHIGVLVRIRIETTIIVREEI